MAFNNKYKFRLMNIIKKFNIPNNCKKNIYQFIYYKYRNAEFEKIHYDSESDSDSESEIKRGGDIGLYFNELYLLYS